MFFVSRKEACPAILNGIYIFRNIFFTFDCKISVFLSFSQSPFWSFFAFGKEIAIYDTALLNRRSNSCLRSPHSKQPIGFGLLWGPRNLYLVGPNCIFVCVCHIFVVLLQCFSIGTNKKRGQLVVIR